MHHPESIEDNADFYYSRAFDLFDESPALALKNLYMALEYEPHHLKALVLAGELHLFRSEHLGIMEDDEALTTAMGFFERALAHEPRHAEAWSRKALTLFYLERDEDALRAAERGLDVLPLRIGQAMESAAMFTNIAESLHNVKVKALLGMGQREQAREALTIGLSQCPGSELLTRRIEAVLPSLG